jgi:hypothetical protein
MKETGIVLFCDILGYRTFLAQNEDITAAVEGVIKTIESAAEKSKEKTFEILPSCRDHISITEQRNSRIFADSIILTMPFDDNDIAIRRAVRWVYFLCETMLLHEHMFQNGLPLRGAIAVGSYYFSQSSFAGKPIGEAYDEADKLQLSAIGITPKAFVEFIAATKNEPELNNFIPYIIHSYATPCKSGGTVDKNLLGFGDQIMNRVKLAENNALASVRELFSAHRKTLDAGAEEKAKNTLNYIMHLAK